VSFNFAIRTAGLIIIAKACSSGNTSFLQTHWQNHHLLASVVQTPL
jgi:hypothetical protein